MRSFSLRDVPRYFNTVVKGCVATGSYMWNWLFTPLGKKYVFMNTGVVGVHIATNIAEKKKLITSETKKDIDEFANGLLFYFSTEAHKVLWSTSLVTKTAHYGPEAKILIEKVLLRSVAIAENLVKFQTIDALIKSVETWSLQTNITYLTFKHLPTQVFKFGIMSIPKLFTPNLDVTKEAAYAHIAGSMVYPIRAWMDTKFVNNATKPDYAFEAAVGVSNNLLIYLNSPDCFSSIPLPVRLILSGLIRIEEAEARKPYWDSNQILKNSTNILKLVYEPSFRVMDDNVDNSKAVSLTSLETDIGFGSDKYLVDDVGHTPSIAE